MIDRQKYNVLRRAEVRSHAVARALSEQVRELGETVASIRSVVNMAYVGLAASFPHLDWTHNGMLASAASLPAETLREHRLDPDVVARGRAVQQDRAAASVDLAQAQAEWTARSALQRALDAYVEKNHA